MSKKKSLLVVGLVNLGMFIYLMVIALAMLKMFGHDDDKAYYYMITNSVINSHSSLEDDNSFIYHSYNEELDDTEEIIFSSSGDSASIGTYDPQSYIYGTDDKSLYIAFALGLTKVSKVRYNDVKVCDIDGNNAYTLSSSDYDTYYSDGYFVLKYSNNASKYIYSVSLTFYVKR